MTRFSKKQLRDHIEDEIGRLEVKWGLDRMRGTVQLAKNNTDRAIAYGRLQALDELIDRFQLWEV